MRWNRTYNLTAIRDPREMVGQAPARFAGDASRTSTTSAALADLGTGAGLPGIPLAIAKPALAGHPGREQRQEGALPARSGAHSWACATRASPNRGSKRFDEPGAFDAITARALATLPLILELGGHLLKPGGRLLAMKGAHPDEEIAALPAGWRLRKRASAHGAGAGGRTAPGRGRAAT